MVCHVALTFVTASQIFSVLFTEPRSRSLNISRTVPVSGSDGAVGNVEESRVPVALEVQDALPVVRGGDEVEVEGEVVCESGKAGALGGGIALGTVVSGPDQRLAVVARSCWCSR